MLTEIIPGRTYRRKDGVIVTAGKPEMGPNNDSCIPVREPDDTLDPWFRWTRSGQQDPLRPIFSSCNLEMTAGQVPRSLVGNNDEREKYDLIECVSHPEFEIKHEQLELFE